MKEDKKYQEQDKDRQRIYEQWPQYSLIEKIKYIISYYGIAIVIVIIAICCVIFFVNDIRKTKVEEAYYVMIIGIDIEEAQVTQIEDDLNNILGLDTASKRCMVEADYSSNANMQSAATISAYMQSGRVDMVIASETDFNLYASTGYLAIIEYDDYKEEDLFYAELVDYSEGGAVRELLFHPHEKTEESGCYGVYIKGGIFDGYVVGVMSNSTSNEYNQKALEYFLSNNNKY